MAGRAVRLSLRGLRAVAWTGPGAFWRSLAPALRGYWQLLPWAPWLTLAGITFLVWVYLPWSAGWATAGGFNDPLHALARECRQLALTSYRLATWATCFTWNSSQSPFIARWAVRLAALFGGLGVGLPLGSLILLAPLHVALANARTGRRRQDSSHGSAAWGTPMQARRAGFLGTSANGPGFVLGRFPGLRGRRCDPRFAVRSHILTLAPNGMGKGVGCVIPNLLTYPGPIVCLDVKGENHAVTARARRQLGQEVYRLDPFGLASEPSHGFNWFSAIDLQSEACVSDAEVLADAIVIREGGGESFWDDSAAALLRGLVLHVATLAPERRHPGELRSLLTLPGADLAQEMEKIALQDDLAFGVPARAARTFLGKEQRERSSVLSTALRHTTFLDDPRIVRTLSRSDIDFAALKRRPATIYLMVPAEMVGAYRRYLRATLDLALRTMYRTPPGEREVLILLDEFAQLGHCTQVEDAISLVRGYGVRFWLLCQDISQLKGTYRRWQTFLANTTQQVFGTQDLETARLVSETLGQGTISLTSLNISQTIHGRGPHSTGTSRGEHSTGRSLMTPDEVMHIPPSLVLVFTQGHPPYQLERLNYLQSDSFRPLWDLNPMHNRPHLHN